MVAHDDTSIALSVRVWNERAKEIVLAVEPWGDTYEMAPGESIDARVIGPAASCCIEVIYEDTAIVLSLWSGASVRLFRGSAELGAGDAPREPAP